MFHVILACATLLNLSFQTKVEMRNLLPNAAEYCLEHPNGKLSVVYGPVSAPKKSDIMQQGSLFYEASNVGNLNSTNGSPVLR